MVNFRQQFTFKAELNDRGEWELMPVLLLVPVDEVEKKPHLTREQVEDIYRKVFEED